MLTKQELLKYYTGFLHCEGGQVTKHCYVANMYWSSTASSDSTSLEHDNAKQSM